MKATSIHNLFRLLSWLSPAFPTGAYAYSHGIEWAVEAGDITDEASLEAWLATLLTDGAARNDAILLRLAYRSPDDPSAVADLAATTAASAERQMETLAQGSAFRLAIRDWQPQTAAALPASVAYPVAVGVAAAHAGITEDDATLAFLQAWSANLVSAGVRLIPLGQSAGLRVLAALEPLATATMIASREAGADDIGSFCFRADIAAMRHETQHTRLFRT
jgi:urease accessory protein